MSKLLDVLRDLFNLSEEQVAQAELDLNNVQKSETDTEETAENQGIDKKESETVEKVDTTTDKKTSDKNEPEGDKKQSARATSNTEGVEETVNREDYKKLEDEIVALKSMLEQTQAERTAERRDAKIKSFKDVQDYDILTTLLDGVEDKDIDGKVAELRKDKGYLFKKPETEGFNPATPQNTLTGVEAAFLELNPDIKLS